MVFVLAAANNTSAALIAFDAALQRDGLLLTPGWDAGFV